MLSVIVFQFLVELKYNFKPPYYLNISYQHDDLEECRLHMIWIYDCRARWYHILYLFSTIKYSNNSIVYRNI